MPTISVRQGELFSALGQELSDEAIDDLCFDLGLEIDDKEEVKDDDGQIYTELKIEVPANRYDLLCIEGLSQVLNVYLGRTKPPLYTAVKPDNPQRMTISPNTAEVRPHAVMAVLRNIKFDARSYKSFIDLQDKLHQNICRQRSLVAIGTHDLDTIKGPFLYDALPPEQIKFKALSQEKEMTAPELMELYSKDSHLKTYLPIIRDKPRYPVITDSNGVVLSMPPIINGHHSRITLDTRNVLIECTATDLTKAKIVLDTIVCMFSVHCSPQFTAESCEVITPSGEKLLYPCLQYRQEDVSVDLINKDTGMNESAERVAQLLSRMCLVSEALPVEARMQKMLSGAGHAGAVRVTIPPTRADVLHACDIVEDAAISHGFNNIQRRFPQCMTIAAQYIVNKVTDLLRIEMAAAGYTEVLTFALCSRDDVSTKLGHDLSTVPAVHIANPKTLEFQVGRTTLLPGILKTVGRNKGMKLPLKLFEIQDVILKDPSNDTGSCNRRDLCAVYVGTTTGFEQVHGLLERVMQLLEVPSVNETGQETGFSIRSASDATFFPGRCAEVLVGKKVIGKFGVLHPNVLSAFDLTQPSSALTLELNSII